MFQDLRDYLLQKMKMSHVYQPVMIRRLLINHGAAKATEIAIDLVQNDLSQIEYYTARVNEMVGKVLRNNHVVDKDKDCYHLRGYAYINNEEREELIKICEQKIEEYKEKRGMNIWDHRRRNRTPVDGSIRYKVLNRANNVCELCGISSEERALEVDHIIPKNWGGKDDITNYQALCWQCNAGKRDTDASDFRGRGRVFEEKVNYCLFCQIEKPIVAENQLVYAIQDGYPVVPNHTLIIPKRHFDSYFDLKQAEFNAVHQLLSETKNILQAIDSSISGFNIGINQGSDAGQTISHCHIHLIPRRKGDIENPRGGVRHIIPGKGFY